MVPLVTNLVNSFGGKIHSIKIWGIDPSLGTRRRSRRWRSWWSGATPSPSGTNSSPTAPPSTRTMSRYAAIQICQKRSVNFVKHQMPRLLLLSYSLNKFLATTYHPNLGARLWNLQRLTRSVTINDGLSLKMHYNVEVIQAKNNENAFPLRYWTSCKAVLWHSMKSTKTMYIHVLGIHWNQI